MRFVAGDRLPRASDLLARTPLAIDADFSGHPDPMAYANDDTDVPVFRICGSDATELR